jgi:hypothetical protein
MSEITKDTNDNEEYNGLGWENSYTHKNKTNALYADCYGDPCLDKFFYTPKNNLDVELFTELTSSYLLLGRFITISEEIELITDEEKGTICPEQCSFGEISRYEKSKICGICNLRIPIDMTYYTNNNQTNFCVICYNNRDDQNETLITNKQESGLDNLGDWSGIFYLTCPTDLYIYQYFCNLNKNSIHYAKFAVNGYESGCGDCFEIVKETNIEDILKSWTFTAGDIIETNEYVLK